MGWHIIKHLLQAVPVLLETLSRIDYHESNPVSHLVNVCNPSAQLKTCPELAEGTASVTDKSVKSVVNFP
jgi:hypothetical protein